jgi:DNA-binding NarL/FixJ family response regulator
MNIVPGGFRDGGVPAGTLHVAVVSDHPVIRRGLVAMLEPHPELRISWQGGTDEVLRTDPAQGLDVAIVDLCRPEDPGLRTVLATIRRMSLRLPVLVLTDSRGRPDTLAAMHTGAARCVTKQASRDAYVKEIRAVCGTDSHASADAGRDREDVLSRRERETLTYIALGLTHHQAANRMGVSKATVDTYVARIRAKLNLGNKAELAIAALSHLQIER